MRNIISGKCCMLRIFLAFAVFMPVAVSCEFSGSNGPGGGYGFPYADFEVTGTVIDDLNQPVQGIRVWYEDTMCSVCYCDTAPDGTFVIEGCFTPSSSIVLNTMDLGDGQNWYDYEDSFQPVQLELVEEPREDDDVWFRGVYAGEVTIMIFRNMNVM